MDNDLPATGASSRRAFLLGGFGLLILYQLGRLRHTRSATLATLIVIDLAVCYLIWREYGFRRADAAAAAAPAT